MILFLKSNLCIAMTENTGSNNALEKKKLKIKNKAYT